MRPGETVDPVTRSRELSPSGRLETPVLEIAYHPDLRRIGDVTPYDLLVDGEAVVVGRASPAFLDGTWSRERPLEDPCVSRRQLTVRWDAARGVFHVESVSGARRSLRLLTPAATPMPGGGPLPPGSFVAIGDRVLLHLALRPMTTPDDDRMGMVGETGVAWRLREQIRSAARTGADVLVQGETGVGKELVARAIHECGERGDRPFLAVNCAAVSEQLFESELFGHRRGAFTGANADAPGIFRAAGAGTVFLDEIGELPLATQARLLRVLQERTVKPVGEAREVRIAARVVAATLRDLAGDVARGRFREDLYARLETPCVRVAPLRARRADIPRLFVHFLRRHDEDAAHWWREIDERAGPIPMHFFLDLLAAPWQRNVRQLEKYALTTVEANRGGGHFAAPPLPGGAAPADFEPAAALDPPSGAGAPSGSLEPSSGIRAPVSAATLQRLFERHHYNQHRVAAELGIARTTLYRWMDIHGFRRPRDLKRDEIVRALDQAGGDISVAAAVFRVSPRGLQLRMKALAIPLSAEPGGDDA